MRKFKVLLAAFVLAMIFGGCAALDLGEMIGAIKNKETTAVTEEVSEKKEEEPKKPEAGPSAQKADEPKATEQKATEAQKAEPKVQAPIYNADIERSNLFQGSRVVSAGGYLYMSDPDLGGFYRVSPDGKDAQLITDIYSYNLIYWDGYVYYISLSYDYYATGNEPASFKRVRAGGVEEEIIMEEAFCDFFIEDGKLYYYGKVGEDMGSYYETDYTNLYCATLHNPENAEIIFRANGIFRAWPVDGKIILLAQGDEHDEYPPYYYTDIVELDPVSGDWEALFTDDGFMDDFLPYKDVYIVQPHIFDVFQGNDCSLYGLDLEWPKSFLFTGLGHMSLDGENQYIIMGNGSYDNDFSESLIESENWGKDYEILIDLGEYMPKGYYPYTNIFRAEDCLYLYVNVYPYDYNDPAEPNFIICYDIESGTYSIMDIFEQ